MNWNYLKIAWRIILKNKVNTIINVVGLGLGFSVSILLLIYVHHQLSFDRFHEHADRLARLTVEGSMADGKVLTGAITSGEVADLLTDNVAGLDGVSRLYYWSRDVYIDEQRFTGDRILWADTSFFSMFNFDLLYGNPREAIRDPHCVVLTATTANKYFGSEDALNQTIRIAGQDYRVTGILKDIPAESSIRFDIVGSFSSLTGPDWNILQNEGLSFPTFVMFNKAADRQQTQEQILQLADQHLEERFGPHGIHFFHHIQPFKRMHLFSRFSFDDSHTGDIRHVYIFSFLAFFVIMIAIFNFVNLITAQSEKRAREIGMRKVMGAHKTDLIWQYVGESVLIAIFAMLLAFFLNEILIGPFSHLLDEPFRLTYWNQPWMLAVIFAFVLLVGVLSGVYPAFYLSRFRPAVVLKGGQHGNGRTHILRKILVGVQFTISIFLVSTLFLGHTQIRFMKHKDLGFDREHVVTIRQLSTSIMNAYESLKAELLQNPDILHVTASQSTPGENRSVQNSRRRGDDPSSAIMIFENRIQHGYLETFGIRLLEGRDFDPEMGTDTSAIILNQAAVRKLGLDNPIGQDIFVWNHEGRVIGVVEDYSFQSLHNEIDPLALTMYSNWFSRISIRMQPGRVRETMDFIRHTFESADPNYVFDYQFVDERFQRMYQKEEQISNLITAAALLAIIISFLGLYALTSFAIRQKVKEIGIRKVMGASTWQIIKRLLGELSLWIIIGNAVAWPLSWLVFTNWQQNFAFQINALAHWHLFVLAGLLTALTGSLAMLYQALSAAKANPVESLRTE